MVARTIEDTHTLTYNFRQRRKQVTKQFSHENSNYFLHDPTKRIEHKLSIFSPLSPKCQKSAFIVFKTFRNMDSQYELYDFVSSNMSSNFLFYFNFEVIQTDLDINNVDKLLIREIKDSEDKIFLRAFCDVQLKDLESYYINSPFKLTDMCDYYFANFIKFLNHVTKNKSLKRESLLKKFLLGVLIALGFTFEQKCELVTEFKIICNFHFEYGFDDLIMAFDFLVIEKEFANNNFKTFDKKQKYNLTCIVEVGDEEISKDNIKNYRKCIRNKVEQSLIYILGFFCCYKLKPGKTIIIVVYRNVWGFFEVEIQQEWVNDFYLLKLNKNDKRDITGITYSCDYFIFSSKSILINYLIEIRKKIENLIEENLSHKL